MRTFELGEELPNRPQPSISLVLKALSDAFLRIRPRGDIEQPLGDFRQESLHRIIRRILRRFS